MAGRGGGGRGGRGGGRWGGRQSATHDLIRDNLEDLGIDSFQAEDMRVPPPLYPPISLPEPKYPNNATVDIIRKHEDLVTRMQAMPYHMSRKKTTTKKSEVPKDDVDLGQISFNAVPDNWSRYVPHELFDNSQLRSRLKNKNLDLNMLKNLEQQEKSGDGEQTQKKEDGAESDAEQEGEPMEDMEMDDDYMVDHYASDGDNDDYGDDDREATF